MKKPILIKAVKPEVKKALAHYCRDNNLLQGDYLEQDKRIKDYIKLYTAKV